MKAPKLSKEQIAEAYEMYEGGLALRVIGESFGVSEGCVRHSFKRAHLPRIKRRLRRLRMTDHQVREAHKMYLKGAFYREVAQSFGVDTAYLYRAFKALRLRSLGRRTTRVNLPS